MTGPDLSIVIPLHDEEENIPFLVEGIRSALGGRNWELILVDDGSRDGTLATACRAAGADDRIRVLRLARNYGQSTALQAGFDHARGTAIVSLDGDLQNDPGEIPLLLERLEEGS
ncbi:MAG: glycosyltransferase, partial [Gemmatimonadales bacterium]